MSRSTLIYICLLAAVVSALYGQFLGNAIVFDDAPFFMVGEAGHQPVDDYKFSLLELRSLPYATLAWSKAAFGLDMRHFRIENALLHAAVAIALFFLLSGLFRRVIPKQDKHLSPEALAFCAALMFVLHPVAVYAAGYLVQRTILMATLFSLLAVIAWMHGSVRKRSGWLWMSVGAYYFAAFSKEHAIMLPAVLLALTVLLHEDWRARIRTYWPQALGFLLIAVFVFAAKINLLGTTYEVYAPEMLADPQGGSNYLLSILTQSWLFFKYAGLWLFPNPDWMSVDMREPFATSIWSGYLLALCAFISWGAISVWLLFKRGYLGLIGFGLLFPWLMFMPELSTIRIQESFVLYRSYLWAAGACAVLPLLLVRLDKKVAGLLVALVALAMFPVSMDRLASFSHPLLLWDDAEKLVTDKQDLPGVFRIYYNRGNEYLKLGDDSKAIDDFTHAARLNPDWPFAFHNMGVAYGKKQQWQLAVDAYSEALDIADRKRMGFNPNTYLGRALSYEKLGNQQLALKDYAVACNFANKGCDKLRELGEPRNKNE